jgi:hypothetical protein
MLKRILVVLALGCAVVGAADSPSPASKGAGNPPSEASIKQLFELTHARQMVDTMMTQMDTAMNNAMQQVTQGQSVSPEVQKTFDQCRSEVTGAMKEQFTWEKLEPMHVRMYQKTLTQGEVDGMVAFYKTPAGQATVNKMPAIMQESMTATMQMMTPMAQRIRRMQQDVATQIQAEKAQKGGG